MLPFRLSAGLSAGYAPIQKKIYGLGNKRLIILNEEMEDSENS